MNRIIYIVLTIWLGIINSGCYVSHALRETIPSSAAIGIQDERTVRIEAVIKKTMRRKRIPGISVAVIDGGELVWAQGFGWRDVKNRLPVDTETIFQAGSISKNIAALTVLVLSDTGGIDLNKDVNSILKSWQLPSKCQEQPVTLRHLLTHQAGTGPKAFMGFHESRKAPTLIEVLNGYSWYILGIRRPVKVIEPPESGYRYSGGGYCVVQQVLEDSEGESFDRIAHQRVLDPLMMTHSTFLLYPDKEMRRNIANGYGWFHGTLFRGRWRIYPEAAAAGLWTTPSDLARMIIAIQRAVKGNSTGPLSTEVAKEFLKPQFEPEYGMGVFLGNENGDPIFFFGGFNWGYVSKFRAGVTNGRGWVIMSNGQNTKFFDPIVEAISDAFGWDTDNSTPVNK